jgi:hypothetical protein
VSFTRCLACSSMAVPSRGGNLSQRYAGLYVASRPAFMQVTRTVQCVLLKEYLSTLIEFSPLKDAFAAWTEKLGKEAEPPSAADLVVPDPARLDAAAVAQARQETASSAVSDPARLTSLLDEGGVAGAVAAATRPATSRKMPPAPATAAPSPSPGPAAATAITPTSPRWTRFPNPRRLDATAAIIA